MTAATKAVAGRDPESLQIDVAGQLEALDTAQLREAFRAPHEFLHAPTLLSPAMMAKLLASAQATRGALHRNHIPVHKKGGSVSRYSIDRLAPLITQLYAAPALVGWLPHLCGRWRLPAATNDAHANALYFYTEPGDHIGWHYDSSYDLGARYTGLLGVVDHSSCKLGYRLHMRKPGHAVEAGERSLTPGDRVFFNGDNVQHRITPLQKHEERVSLPCEYVTASRMARHRRFISNMKDAIGCFGFRHSFRHSLHGRD